MRCLGPRNAPQVLKMRLLEALGGPKTEAALFERQEDFFDDKAARVLKWTLAHGRRPSL